MSDPSCDTRPDLAARRQVAREIRSRFITASPDPGSNPALVDLAALLTKWESGGVHGIETLSPPINPERPTDHHHG